MCAFLGTVPEQLASAVTVTPVGSLCLRAVLKLGQGYSPYPGSISRATEFGPGTANPFENNYLLMMEQGNINRKKPSNSQVLGDSLVSLESKGMTQSICPISEGRCEDESHLSAFQSRIFSNSALPSHRFLQKFLQKSFLTFC